jgi:hypothetical protein
MKSLSKHTAILFFLCCTCTWLGAQRFDIRLTHAGGSTISVEMRETTGKVPFTADILTDLVFGICWDKSYGIDLDLVQSAYTIEKAGPEGVYGSIEHQFFAKDANPLHFPVSWEPNTWHEIMRVSNNAASTVKFGAFSICPESLQELNINYNLIDYGMTVVGAASGVRIGLPDIPRVGETTSIQSKGLINRGEWSISPNPGVNKFDVTLESPVEEDVQLVVSDASGKVVFTDVYSLRSGRNVLPLLLVGTAPGVYQVGLQWKEGNVQSKSIVVVDP